MVFVGVLVRVRDCVAVFVAVLGTDNVAVTGVTDGSRDGVAVAITPTVAVLVPTAVVRVGDPVGVTVCVCTGPVGVIVMKYSPVAATRVAAPGSMVAPYTRSTAVFVARAVARDVAVTEAVCDAVGVIVTNRSPCCAIAVSNNISLLVPYGTVTAVLVTVADPGIVAVAESVPVGFGVLG
jgi:hypothetical protein